MANPFTDDEGRYLVLLNDEEQYSLWPGAIDVPAGGGSSWNPTGARRVWPTLKRSGPTCARKAWPSCRPVMKAPRTGPPTPAEPRQEEDGL